MPQPRSPDRPDIPAPDGAHHACAADALLADLAVSPDTGLSPAEAADRLRRYGPNTLAARRSRSPLTILVAQFRSVLVALLAAAVVLSFYLGDWAEGIAVAVVILINTLIGFVTEYRADRSMEALRQMTRTTARVRRGGRLAIVPADDLVPGDIAVLEGGDVVGADLRLIEAATLETDESTLTGESMPIAKDTETLPADTALADRRNMAFRGTMVTRGAGLGLVVATGTGSEIGRIAAMVAQAGDGQTPLERRLDRLAASLVWLALALVALASVAALAFYDDPALIIKTAIALAVAAVPEGLPVVVTLALARGMWRMAARNALIRNLAAVETLGATTVVFTDKTGTLTENRMTVVRLALAGGPVELRDGEAAGFYRDGAALTVASTPDLEEALAIAALCNEAQLSASDDGDVEGAPRGGIGDPLELALLSAAATGGLTRAALERDRPRLRTVPFDARTKMMATFHRTGTTGWIAVKGAPEAVLAVASQHPARDGDAPLTTADRAAWLEQAERMAADGLRVLALADRAIDAPATRDDADPYQDLRFVGLVGLHDPPRPDVAAAIARCREAGVRVVMLTGDHAETARAIARSVGLTGREPSVVTGGALSDLSALGDDRRSALLATDVFARVTPGEKLELVDLFRGDGQVVAMTGDGVNDAPALKQADIGVAMGRRGTQVAREAADMVLRDDSFASIVAAMEQGRIIFGNIRRFVLYLLSCNLSEILVIFIAVAAGLPQPLLPLQILFLNLVTDVFPALALGAGEGERTVMTRPPRDPSTPILDRGAWVSIIGHGLLITAATLGAFGWALAADGLNVAQSVTVAFVTLALAQLWHVFNMRDRGSSVLANEIVRNPFVWGALALCTALIVVAVWVPLLSEVLVLPDPGGVGWLTAIVASLAPLAVGQIFRHIGPRNPRT